MKSRFIFMLMLVLPLAASGQTTVLADPACSQAMADIYKCDFEAYNKSVVYVSDPALRAYLNEYKSLMQYTAANNTENYDIYMDASDDAIDAVDGHKYEYTLMSNLLLHRCLVELSKGSLIGGGIQFWKSYRSFKNGEAEYKNYDGQLMLRGIYNILLSQIPEKWKSIAGFFGFGDGNLEEGFRQISQYRQKVKDVPGVCEESLLLSFANIFLSHDQRVDSSLAAAMRASAAPVVVYANTLSFGRMQRGADAESLLKIQPQERLVKFPLLMHQKAKFALRRLDTASAKSVARDFLSTYKGISCRNDAYLIMAYAYLIEGNTASAKTMADKCISMAAGSDVDKRTLADAKRVEQTDPTLLRARMLFEYGRYAESLEMLKKYTPQQRDMNEYNFRIARAEEKLGNIEQAKTYYNKVIAASATDKRYFGPYSAVYLADINLAAGNKQAASECLAQAKKLNNGEFSKEIDQRIAVTRRAVAR